MKLTIAGMGPGPVSMCTLGAVEAARGAGALFLQTARHPVADYLKDRASLLKRWTGSTRTPKPSKRSGSRRRHC